jgi:hypothetical protein
MRAIRVNADSLQIKNRLVSVTGDPQRIMDLGAAKCLIEVEQIVSAIFQQEYDARTLHLTGPAA